MKKVVDRMEKMFIIYTRVNNNTKEVNDMEQSMGVKIRDRRKSLGMNQEDLAKKSKLSRARISAIENGRCNDILVSTLTTIASALNTTVEFFLT